MCMCVYEHIHMCVDTRKHIMPFAHCFFSNSVLRGHFIPSCCWVLVPNTCLLAFPWWTVSSYSTSQDLPGNATKGCTELGQMLPSKPSSLSLFDYIFFFSLFNLKFPSLLSHAVCRRIQIWCPPTTSTTVPPLLFYCSPPTLLCGGCSDVFLSYLIHFLWCLLCFPI